MHRKSNSSGDRGRFERNDKSIWILNIIIHHRLSSRYSMITWTCIQKCVSTLSQNRGEKCVSTTKFVNCDGNFPFPGFNRHLSGSSPIFLVWSLRFVNWSKNKLKFENPTKTNWNGKRQLNLKHLYNCLFKILLFWIALCTLGSRYPNVLLG